MYIVIHYKTIKHMFFWSPTWDIFGCSFSGQAIFVFPDFPFQHEIERKKIIDPLIPKDMFRLVCLVKLVFFAREGVAF